MNRRVLVKGMRLTSRMFSNGRIVSGLQGRLLCRFASSSTQNQALNQDESVSLYALNNKIYEIKENSASGQIVRAKNDIVYFTNFAKNELRLRSLLEFDGETKGEALVLSLNDKISSALCLKRLAQSQQMQDMTIRIENSQGLQLNMSGQQLCGNIVNFRGEVLKEGEAIVEALDLKKINEQEKSSDNNTTTKEAGKGFKRMIPKDFEVQLNLLNFSEDSMLRQKRQTSQRQLFSGSIAVDMTQPMSVGNFVLLNGELNTGKSHFAAEVIKQNCALNSNVFGIFATQSMSNSERVQALLLADEKSRDNFVVMSPPHEEYSGNADKYLTPLAAVQLAKKMQQEQGRDVIVIFDNVIDHFYTESLIFGEVDMPSGFRSVLKELFSISGSFGERNGSVSSICIFDQNRKADKYEKEIKKLFNEAESYADVIIDFDQRDPLLRQIRPKVSLHGKELVPAFQWQNALFRQVCAELHAMSRELQNQTSKVAFKNELKIQVEPWDYYLYFDAKYFMKLLISSRYMSPVEQIVFVKFILKAIQEETISQFKQTPQELMDYFFSFARNFKEFNKKDIFTHISQEFVYTNNQMHPNTIDNLEHCVLRLYELFIMHCKMNDKLLPFKKDYFN